MDTEFLEMCGFEPEEIKNEIPRAEKVFKILAIEPEDIERAKNIVPERFDLTLKGVRKCLRIWIKELFSLILSKEEKKKIIYNIMPAPSENYQAVM